MKKSLLAVTLLMATVALTGCFKKPVPVVIEQTPEPAVENTVVGTAYQIDLRASNVNWTGRKTLVKSEHTGTIAFKSGQVMLQDNQLTGGSFVIDMPTLTDQDSTGKTKESLETHLKSEDFFDVVKYPEASLTIKSVSPGAITATEQAYNVTADLNIKGVTNTVNFEAKARQDSGLWLATADFSIDRTLWGIKYGSGKFFSDLGDKIIDDMIDFKIAIEVPMSVTTTQTVTSTETVGSPAVVNITTEVVPAE